MLPYTNWNTEQLRIPIVTAAVLTLLLSACQNDPDPTGIGLIPDSDLIGANKFDSQQEGSTITSGTVQLALPAATSPTLSVGEAEGLEAAALLRWFSLSDTIGNGGRIISANIRLFTEKYFIGDSSAALTLELHEINSFWNAFTFNADTLWNSQFAYDSKVVGSVTQALSFPDSIDIALDTTLVRDWLVKMNTADHLSNYGVLLKAPGNAGIRAFQSGEAGQPPQLTVIIQTAFGLDTLQGGTFDDTFVARGPEDVTQGEGITLFGGIGVRGQLHFDLSAIPAADIINYAELYLTIDRTRSDENYHAPDSLIMYQVYTEGSVETAGTGLLSHVDEENPDRVVLEGVTMTRAVQDWVNGKGNYGLLLTHPYEVSDLNRLVFYGAEADSTRRPRLIVTYTSKP